MGGLKKKTMSSSDKNSSQASDGKPQKKEEKSSKPLQKTKVSVLIDENSGLKTLQGMKSITIQNIAKIMGIKISVANSFIKSLESKGTVKLVGGYSGHRIYTLNK
ncbi:MAG: 30S ribosomal protein S25 [Nitrososphaeraceae archaeon]|nr:30S ribosomal protein S25 [Nitrososphaeraceae archaeon]